MSAILIYDVLVGSNGGCLFESQAVRFDNYDQKAIIIIPKIPAKMHGLAMLDLDKEILSFSCSDSILKITMRDYKYPDYARVFNDKPDTGLFKIDVKQLSLFGKKITLTLMKRSVFLKMALEHDHRAVITRYIKAGKWL